MALSSMTGFARSHGVSGSYAWSWEIKSVNAKGLELRLRLPPGFDAVEIPVRTKAAEMLSRGNVYATLSVSREGAAPVVRINEPVLNAILNAVGQLSGRVDAEKPRLDGLLALKGVVDVTDAEQSEEEKAAAEDAIVKGFVQGLKGLVDMRRHEGDAIGRVLSARLDEMAALAQRADAAPGRQPDAVKRKLAEQVAVLLETAGRFDADRLHQEAILLAAKADIREELDRLAAHVAQARKLMNGGGAIGRRLDFLSQELNRETNTLCAKSNDVELTNIGLELKSVVEQFREQVQNLE
ncbi:YicC/YloC family endoribonuclease [Pseudorhodoplanes sp.]|uniref:YicC/YloC family endoribonuclease n=1 Tax=Pseudorhodoplanes sp. TaxID=1934341 RepID=UPI002C868AAA|nr:YicC/YloC family endoribonuclease [Pseudorhodoplanes sp.]HWV43061.1 YicC/YloC family endoribonuclease [Pseudorhodoplanes sp.]